jgi:CubicO group peptidase (beta-lactamase class C family)
MPIHFPRSICWGICIAFAFVTSAARAADPAPASSPIPGLAVSASDAGFTEDGLQKIRTALTASVNNKEFAGINVILYRHGHVGMAESFGFADPDAKKPLTQDTIMRIFSLTKPMTATAAMILYDDGKFQLDDPVSKFIPGFADMKVKDPNGGAPVPLVRPVTVRNLLQHTSGIPGTGSVFRGSLQAMEKQVVTLTLDTQPGDAWVYADSLDVVARLVEIWSGKTYDQFLHERLFGPLGMIDTGYSVPQDKLPRVSAAFHFMNGTLTRDRADNPARMPTYFSGSSDLLSTSIDYLRFARMLLNGGELDGKRILKKETVDMMMTSSVPMTAIPRSGPNGRRGYGYGIGGAVLVDPQAAGTLSPTGEFNWGGASGVFYWVDRKNDVTGVWFVQRQPWDQKPSAAFRNMVYQAMAK